MALKNDDTLAVIERLIASEKAKSAALAEAIRLTSAITEAIDADDEDRLSAAVDGRQVFIDKMEEADAETAAIVKKLPDNILTIVNNIYSFLSSPAGSGDVISYSPASAWEQELYMLLLRQRDDISGLNEIEKENQKKLSALIEHLRGQIGDVKKNRGIMDKYLPDQSLPAGTVFFEKK